MKKIFGVMILLAALLIGGCTNSGMTVSTTNNETEISATNADEEVGNSSVTIPEGSTVQGEAKISSGKLIIRIGGREHIIDKSGEFFIDVPASGGEMSLSAKDGLTGEIKLRALPKI